MKGFLFTAVMGFFLTGALSGCCPVQHDGDHAGRVVDAETGEPIEEAVVLGTWDFISLSAAGALHSFYDAEETITDARGNFTVPGRGFMFLSCLDSMYATVFKTGYECRSIRWDVLKEGYGRRNNFRLEGEIPVIPLRKLTMEERKKQYVPGPPSEKNWENFPIYMKEINRNELELGRESYSMEKEKLDEDFM
ncbi:MAG TPA: carboxypeptidase-like regulatory domain-containing protein [Syntrophales bacterium]|nr:carboxypeptidase-like regulatory domain-containing protein [Syntrophales bacterium]